MSITSCGKEGPQDPAGPAGPQGPNGIVYSNWTNFTAGTRAAFNGFDVASYPVTGVAALNQTMLDRSAGI